ncbi:MAG TPA: 16S rRNA (cytosine(1402)-N(4))-methyltransferase RsmH [Actinomycetota bacterium]|nr:16S rRNA (cytosine(1402)-N(4))-methyltransferase RsmH [Actinomycetota bacterium]
MDHNPVLVDRVVELLLPALSDGGVVVDATLGRGGHAKALLEAAPAIELVGIDWDDEALAQGGANLSAHTQRVRTARADFASLSSVLERFGIASVRGVLFDFGVSSPQLDRPERGFSFRHEGPLDMRMDLSKPLTAAEIVNEYPEPDLARVIRRFGEERFANRIARAIVQSRPLQTTTELAEVIKTAIPAATRRTGGHPARRSFQALRIEVNDELIQIDRALEQAMDVLEAGGRIATLTYHSLEDRIVKRAFAAESRGCTCPPDFPVCVCGAEARLRLVTKRPVRPETNEIELNPRASAAKLRVGERLATAVNGGTE